MTNPATSLSLVMWLTPVSWMLLIGIGCWLGGCFN